MDFDTPYGRTTEATVNKKSFIWRLVSHPAGTAALIAGLLLLIAFGNSLYFQTEAGTSYHYQNTLTGNEDAFTEPGVHFKLPGFSTVTPYKQVFTVFYKNEALAEGNKTVNSSVNPMVTVPFADTYTAQIPGTFRFRLPMDKKAIIKIHHEFRSFANLVDSLVEKTSMDVLINTAPQYTGEEFFLGAINQFKASIIDQLQNGVYATERTRVEVEETGLASVGLGQEDSNKLKKQKKMVWKTIPLTNDKGHYIRQENPLAEYSIIATQFTLGRPIPEKQLQQLLTDKKKLVAARITTIQEQETAKEEAKTAQLKKEIERTKAKQEALKKKDLVLIAMQQEVEAAQKQAEKELVEQRKLKDLAAVEKEKELAIATADRDIQKAAYSAAQYEAKAIKEKGLAQAAVIEAKYKAYDKTLYGQELQRDISTALFTNLKDFKVELPKIMQISGSAGAPAAGDLASNLKLLTDLTLLNRVEPTKQQLAYHPRTRE